MNFKAAAFFFFIAIATCSFVQESLPRAHEEDAPSKTAALCCACIDWYKENISSLNCLGCSYYPSCSQYTKQAIIKYGFVKGWFMGCDRLMRCSNDEWVYPIIDVEGEMKLYDPVL